MLAAIAVAPIAAVPAAAQGTDERFAAALARYREAQAASLAFSRRIFGPASEAYQRECAQIPHVTAIYRSSGGSAYNFSTAKDGDVEYARRLIRLTEEDSKGARLPRSRRIELRSEDIFAAPRKIVAADLKRQRAADRIGQRLDIKALAGRDDELSGLASAATDALIAHPVRNAADLLAKLKVIEAEEVFDIEGTVPALIADARRLAGEA